MNSCKPHVLIHSTWVVVDSKEAEKGAVWGYRKPVQSGLEAWPPESWSLIFQPILGSCWLCLWALWLLGIGLAILLLRSFSLCSFSPLGQSWVVPWSLLFSFILTYCSDHAVCVQASELNVSHRLGVSKWTDQVTPWVSFLYCRNAPGSGSGHSSEALSHHQKCPGSLQWAGEWWLTCLPK